MKYLLLALLLISCGGEKVVYVDNSEPRQSTTSDARWRCLVHGNRDEQRQKIIVYVNLQNATNGFILAFDEDANMVWIEENHLLTDNLEDCT